MTSRVTHNTLWSSTQQTSCYCSANSGDTSWHVPLQLGICKQNKPCWDSVQCVPCRARARRSHRPGGISSHGTTSGCSGPLSLTTLGPSGTYTKSHDIMDILFQGTKNRTMLILYNTPPGASFVKPLVFLLPLQVTRAENQPNSTYLCCNNCYPSHITNTQTFGITG